MADEAMSTGLAVNVKTEDPPTIFDPATCIRKGLCPVMKVRKQNGSPLESHSLYYEIHGSGPEKVIFIMGLNSSAAGWLPQVDYFGRKSDYSVMIFDNRGVGNSDTPRGPYTTSAMAKDIVALVDFVGWQEKRQLHVVGVSLGGMIAQELAAKIPERIASLSLIVTKPGGRRLVELPTYAGLRNLLKATVVRNPEKKISLVLDMIFPKEWLDAKSPDDPEGRTNREVEAESYRKRMSVTRPQRLWGAVSQMAAAMTHHVSPDRLQRISSSIPKVLILVGSVDNLVHTANSHFMKEHMKEAELVVREGGAHGLTMQYKDWVNELLERTFKEGREKASS